MVQQSLKLINLFILFSVLLLLLLSYSTKMISLNSNNNNNKFIKCFTETILLKSYIASHIAIRSEEAIAKYGSFVIAFSGGSMPKLLSDLAEKSEMQWDKIFVLFADERCKY